MLEEEKTNIDEEKYIDDTENDNSADSSSDDNDTDTTQSDEGENSDEDKKGKSADSLDKHPRWREREEDWKKRFNDQEERHTSELTKLREDLESKFESVKLKTNQEIPDWFGGDEVQFKKFNDYLGTLTASAKEKAIQEIKQEQQQQDKVIKEATDYFNSEISEIESSQEINPDGIKVDKNKLLKYTMDNDLVDSKGRWNYRAAFKLMQAGVKNASNKER